VRLRMAGGATGLMDPLAMRIWELYERNPGRSLAPVDVHRDLAGGARGTVAQVNYQLCRLQRSGLVGGGPRESR